MKALYLGVYRDSTGYGTMAIQTMMALITVGIDVTCRPIKLDKSKVELPPQILEAEKKPNGGNSQFDVVIQNILPHMMDYSGNIPLNVGYYCSETSRFDGTNWANYINRMDRAWVCNQQSCEASRVSGVTIPIDIIPIACDISKYQKRYKPLLLRERLKDSFIFYYIGDFNKRKNLVALIKAFHLEFSVNEPVNLVLKTNIATSDYDEYTNAKNRDAITQEVNRVKEEMKLYRSIEQYKQEIILIGHYSDEEILRLHASCDCFVCPSYGEAFSIPSFDAMALGKTPITTACGGFLSYNSMDTGWLVNCTKEPVWGMNRATFDGLFTSREDWMAVDIYHLRNCMREAYEDKDGRRLKASQGREKAYDFSYERVGKEMVKCLTP